MIRIYIFEDNLIRREDLTTLINSQSDLLFVGSRPDCRDIISEIKINLPDLVLLDLNMPFCNGIEGLKIIKSVAPHIKVVIQTIHEEAEKILECIKLGAEGYILKKESPEKILAAIHNVMNGGAMLTPSVAIEILRSISSPPDKSNISILSDREKEVLSFLAEGKSYKMIADILSISYSTVNSHLKKIYEKLHVHSATEAIKVYYS